MTEFHPIPFGKYTLLERIAVVPTAEFYRAQGPDDRGDNHPVFIKKFLPGLSKDTKWTDSFAETAAISRLLEHDNIITVYDFGILDDAFFIASEYLQGHALQELIDASREQNRPFTVENALYLISQVLKGLAYAHAFQGPKDNQIDIVHRNLTPLAVFVTANGDVKITDFGLHPDKGKNGPARTDMMKGKLTYMSPEQVGGDPVDLRNDLFSAGLLLYEMVTGRPAFQGETMKVFSMVRQAQYEPPEAIVSELPQPLISIITRSLQKAPHDRYQSATAMLVDVQQALATMPAQASSETLARFAAGLFKQKATARSEGRDQSRNDQTVSAPQKETVVSSPVLAETKRRSKPRAAKPLKKVISPTPPGPAPDPRAPEANPDGVGKEQVIARPKWRPQKWLCATVSAAAVIVLAVTFLIMRSPSSKNTEQNDSSIVKAALTALEAGKFQQAVFRFEQALAAEPAMRDQISRPYAQALEAQASTVIKTHPKQAEQLLVTAGQFDPRNVHVHTRLGMLYLNRKDYPAAVSAYEKVLQLDLQQADAYFNLGFIHAVNKDYTKAEEMYAQTVQLAPAFLDEALFNLAVVQKALGKRKACIGNLRRALEVNPDNKQAAQYLKTITG